MPARPTRPLGRISCGRWAGVRLEGGAARTIAGRGAGPRRGNRCQGNTAARGGWEELGSRAARAGWAFTKHEADHGLQHPEPRFGAVASGFGLQEQRARGEGAGAGGSPTGVALA